MRIDLGSFDKRKLARIAAVMAVALAAGHLVQTVSERKTIAQHQLAEAGALHEPVDVVPLSGTNEPVVQSIAPKPSLPADAWTLPPVAAQTLPTAPATATEPDVIAADPCPVSLDLMVDPGAMIGLTLLAPCHRDERVVLRHAGLAVTVMTTATGSVFLGLPALETEAVVEARFADGTVVTGGLTVPDLSAVRRFGVQWHGEDAFQVYGFEAAGTVSAKAPGSAPLGNLPMTTGFLTRLGDPGADNPLLAEIYTFATSGPSKVVLEAAVTPATCGREILGETIASVAGSVTITDLTLAMPECDAVGGFLVLNNLAPDLTLAAAN